nr:uncharacterized protein LOC116282293 [Vicugna pacos]
MLPLSTVEGEDTEEVKTKPPEKGALLSENTEDPPKKRSRMKGRMSLKILPFCPLHSMPYFVLFLKGRQPQTHDPALVLAGHRALCLTLSPNHTMGPGSNSWREAFPALPLGCWGPEDVGRGPSCPIPPRSREPCWESHPGHVAPHPGANCSGLLPVGRTRGVRMLPLSAVEGKDTEEVKTTPPEKGALLSENTEDPPSKPSRMKGRMSFKIMPICPLVSLLGSSLWQRALGSDWPAHAPPSPLVPRSHRMWSHLLEDGFSR